MVSNIHQLHLAINRNITKHFVEEVNKKEKEKNITTNKNLMGCEKIGSL